MFTAPKKIIVDGRLAAYEGEVMLEETAKKRGIDVEKFTTPAVAKAKASKPARKAEE